MVVLPKTLSANNIAEGGEQYAKLYNRLYSFHRSKCNRLLHKQMARWQEIKGS